MGCGVVVKSEKPKKSIEDEVTPVISPDPARRGHLKFSSYVKNFNCTTYNAGGEVYSIKVEYVGTPMESPNLSRSH
ncbi:unnamed protein product [Blepharisma stoltei]|uniref:Uncharacterized protein n=1 Tax=Blepharisma stoltei TaxID=1481888 RepID=A0AAU9JGP4_9CILI|nr:unnamed protein product [Blepharisma stoltei]